MPLHYMENNSLKRCSKCKKEKLADEFKGKNQTCNECCEKKKQYRNNNQEKIKEYMKEYNKQNSQKTYICSVCNLEVKVLKQWQHEQTVSHQYYLQVFENNEEPRKPDKIETVNGRIIYHCFACKCASWQNSWGAHCMQHKMEEQPTN